MKNISTILNIVLLVAVGLLYYWHFSKSVKCGDTRSLKSSCNHKIPEGGKSAVFAYVDLDSLNEGITYIRENRKALEAEQESIETEWQNGYQQLENKKNDFLKRGKAATQAEAENLQAELINEQQVIDSKKQKLTQKLNEKSYKFMDAIQQKLKAFLEEYNKDKRFTYIFSTGNGLDYIAYKDSSYNITADVISGMNDMIDTENKKK